MTVLARTASTVPESRMASGTTRAPAGAAWLAGVGAGAGAGTAADVPVAPWPRRSATTSAAAPTDAMTSNGRPTRLPPKTMGASS